MLGGTFRARTPNEGDAVWETRCAESIRSFAPDGGRGGDQISRRRFPGGTPGCIRALRGDRRSDPARRTQILERRLAGSVREPRRRATAAFFRRSTTAGRRRRTI